MFNLTDSSFSQFYTYILIDPDTLDPFYIGKGKDNRAEKHIQDKRPSLKSDRIQQIKEKGYLNYIIEYFIKDVDEETAFYFEKELIKKYGRLDLNTGILCNMTDGGEGGNITSGKKSISNEELQICIRVNPSEIDSYINLGWKLGMLEKYNAPRRKKLNVVWSHHPVTKVEVKKEHVPSGYILGRSPSVHKKGAAKRLGEKQSPEWIENRVSKCRGRKKPGTAKALLNTIWLHKNNKCVRVKTENKEEYLISGWQLGRPFFSRNKGK
jgi:hypothetical protein